jgi:hypothetical protein
MNDGQEPKRYSPGERITIGIELYDDNGIFYVAGRFAHADYPKVHITLVGYGGGKRHTTVYIQNVVVTNTLPGQYVCEYVEAQDGRGNCSVLHPNITFYVEQQSALVDDQGPQLKGWCFLPQGAIEFVEASMSEWNRREKHLDTERKLALTARDTTEETGAQSDIQQITPGTRATPEDMQGDPPEDEWVDTQQYVENYINEKISEMTEDTGAGANIDLHIERSIAGMTEETGSGADIGAHIESRMDEIAHDVTEETDSEGDPHLHVQRRMDEMAKKIFEDD